MTDSTFVFETFDEVLPRSGGSGAGRKGHSKYPFATMPVGTRVTMDVTDRENEKRGAALRRIQQVAYGTKREDQAHFLIRRVPENPQLVYVYCVAAEKPTGAPAEQPSAEDGVAVVVLRGTVV